MNIDEYEPNTVQDEINEHLERLEQRNECLIVALQKPFGFPPQPETDKAFLNLYAEFRDGLVDIIGYHGYVPTDNIEVHEFIKNRLEDIQKLNDCYQAHGAIRKVVNIKTEFQMEERDCKSQHIRILQILKTM